MYRGGPISTALDFCFSDLTRASDAFVAGAKVAARRPSPAAALYTGTGSGYQGRTSPASFAHLYRHNTGWSYSSIKVIGQRIAGQPIRLARLRSYDAPRRRVADEVWLKRSLPDCFKAHVNRIDVLESHSLLDTLADPNPLMVTWTLVFVTVAALEITGRSYWWVYDQAGRRQVFPLPPDWVTPKHEDRLFGSYEVRPFKSSTPIEVPGDEIVNFYYPDPSNPLSALSPMQAQLRAIVTDEAIQESQAKAFQHGIFPSVLITVGRHPDLHEVGGHKGKPLLTQDQRTQLALAIEEQYQGAVRSGRPIILDALIDKVEPFSATPQEMAFLESGSSTKSRIYQGFGVNPVVTGQLEGANRASSIAADENFINSNINPKITLISQTLTEWFGPMFAKPGEKLLVWIEPAVSMDPELDIKKLDQLGRFGAITVNELRAHHGYEPRADGEILIPSQYIQHTSLTGESGEDYQEAQSRLLGEQRPPQNGQPALPQLEGRDAA